MSLQYSFLRVPSNGCLMIQEACLVRHIRGKFRFKVIVIHPGRESAIVYSCCGDT